MKKILVIDDDLTFQKTIRDTLESLGYAVVEAHDGVEGLKAVEAEKPNLILLDIVMPKLGGIEFLKILQKDKGGNPFPILITSNFSGIGKIDEGLELGIRGYIIKSNESLKTIVSNVELLIGEADK
jgi:two-component system chemotaxis response regulator CheY